MSGRSFEMHQDRGDGVCHDRACCIEQPIVADHAAFKTECLLES